MIIGYLGQDPKVTTTQAGAKVASISVGTTERGFTTKEGKVIPDRTEWHNVIVWRQGADFIEKYVRKGSQVFVQGKLRHKQYVDQQTQQTKYYTEIEADVFELLDRAPQANGQGYGQPQQQAGFQAPAQPQMPCQPQSGYVPSNAQGQGAGVQPSPSQEEPLPF